MNNEGTTNLAREVRAARIVKRVREIHALGMRAMKHLQRNPSLTDFAAGQKLSADSVRKARRFAEQYTPAELQHFCDLRGPDGTPLTWRRATELTRIHDRSARKLLQSHAAEQGWSQAELVQTPKSGQNRACVAAK